MTSSWLAKHYRLAGTRPCPTYEAEQNTSFQQLLQWVQQLLQWVLQWVLQEGEAEDLEGEGEEAEAKGGARFWPPGVTLPSHAIRFRKV